MIVYTKIRRYASSVRSIPAKADFFYRSARAIYGALLTWAETSALSRALLESDLSPIDKHIAHTKMIGNQLGLYNPFYDEWRAKRCNKLLEIYGVDYFKGKRILELGSGHGEIGAFFAELGASVLCLDARAQNIAIAKLKHRKLENIAFKQFNLETDFSEVGRFDLVINFGLIYHLRNVEAHIKACFACADDIVVETVVCDSTDPQTIFFVDQEAEWKIVDPDESSFEGVGSLPSPDFVERIASESGYDFTRYRTPDLNFGPCSYDWEPKNDNRLGENMTLRRFWRLTKTGRVMDRAA